MSKIGLAKDLVITSEERIKAKVADTKEAMANEFKTKIEMIYEVAVHIAQIAQVKLDNAEKSAGKLAVKARKKLQELEVKANNLAINAKAMLAMQGEVSERIFAKVHEKFLKVQSIAQQLESNFSIMSTLKNSRVQS